MSPATLTALVVAIGFAAGLNVYLTALALGVMARLHWAVLPGTLGEIANPWVMGACGVLFAAEFVADKIPGVDVLSNVAHTFVRIPLAALMAYAASANLPPEMHLLATAVGTAFAAAAHSSKTVARLVVTPSPEPVSNIALSSLEDVLALGVTWCAVHQPWWTAGAVGALTLGGIVVIWLGAKAARRAWTKLRAKTGSAGLSRQPAA